MISKTDLALVIGSVIFAIVIFTIVMGRQPKCEVGWTPVLDRAFQWSCGKEGTRGG